MTEPLAALFNAVRIRREHERLEKAQTEAQRRERADAARQKENEKEKERDAKELDDLIFMIEVQRQIAEIEERMARNYEILRTAYGDDVIGGMAATWLTREHAAELKTDDERLQALSEKFLNEDDSIKPPYKDLVDAHYVQDWSVLGKLENTVSAKVSRDVSDVGPAAKAEGLVPF